MHNLLMAAYGLSAYLAFMATMLYAVAFVANLPVPRTLDIGPAGPASRALAIDLLLLAVFAVQHSVMARAPFKRAWTRTVPQAAERSTYVLAASLALAVLMGFWQPIAQPVLWDMQAGWPRQAVEAVFWAGWALVVASSYFIDHFELFGLRQAATGLFRLEAPDAQFRTPLLYKHVRHPLYLGFLIAFWATPRMTAGHLVFALGFTGYILLGIWFEERDLVARFGERYRDYQRQVGMLLPWRRR